MNIEKLEINVLKASEIKDGDILLIKMEQEEKEKLNKDSIKKLYDQVLGMINKKDISIYFFPKNIDIDIIKNHVKNIEEVKDSFKENQSEQNENK